MINVTNNRYRLGYHLMPAGGWINDPNGFTFFKGYYHLFYQFYPDAAEWGPMHWGHARSKDLVHWETLPVALVPGDQEDGCFSGSAIVHDNKLWLIYTGHHYIDKQNDDFYETQNVAYSEDGIHFVKYQNNPVIAHPPADNTKHFRDPKVWRENDHFNMVVGSQDKNKCGRVLLYRSNDLLSWQFVTALSRALDSKQEGFMWECPDFFPLNGEDVLLCSPQGLQPVGDRFLNENQTGYFVGNYDELSGEFERNRFVEIDHGHDFYATQTTLTPDGRRIMVAWLNAWDSSFKEQADGWCGAITFPRELTLIGNKIYQQPVREIKALRKEQVINKQTTDVTTVKVPSQSELVLNYGRHRNGELFALESKNQRFSVVNEHGRIVIHNAQRDERAVIVDDELLRMHVLLDTSSIEIFINDGEATFTERVYWDEQPTLRLPGGVNAVGYRLDAQANLY